MSEQELNSYRFLSNVDPSDEMLEAIMHEATQDAIKRQNDALIKMERAMDERRSHLHKKYSEKINQILNGRI